MSDDPVSKLGLFGITYSGPLGTTFKDATGLSEGSSTADAPATGFSSTATGISAGIASVIGIAAISIEATGSSEGDSIAEASGITVITSVGDSDGSSIVSGSGGFALSGTGVSSGTSTTTAHGSKYASGIGTSSGTSTAVASASKTADASGLSEGVSFSFAVSSEDDYAGTGEAAGSSTAIGSSSYSKRLIVNPAQLYISSQASFYSYEYIESCSGDNAPLDHIVDSKKLDADAYVDLFEITLSDGVTKLYMKMNKTVVWQGHTYEGTGIKIEGVGSYADDQVSRPKLTIFNPENVFSYLIDQGLIENARIVRIRVLKEHVMSDTPIYRKQQWFVKRVSSVKKNFIGLELRDMLDGQNFLTPGRMFIPPEFKSVSLS